MTERDILMRATRYARRYSNDEHSVPKSAKAIFTPSSHARCRVSLFANASLANVAYG
jgi:hypothetical protein